MATEAGKRFQDRLDYMVKGRPFSSHSAERAVGLGVRLERKHGRQITDSHFSSVHSAKSNNSMEDMRNAACQYEREQQAAADADAGRAAAAVAWVGDKPKSRKRTRPPSLNYRNKAVIGLAALHTEKRAAKVPRVCKAAYVHAGTASAAGVDIASREEKRKRTQFMATVQKKEERGRNAQASQYTDTEMKKRAAAVKMPRVQCGLVDLDEAATKKKPAVDELIAECEARGLELPGSGGTVKKTGRGSSGTKIGKAHSVSLLRAANGNKRYLKLQSDAAAKAAAWDGDDAAMAMAVEDGPSIGLWCCKNIYVSFSPPTYSRWVDPAHLPQI